MEPVGQDPMFGVQVGAGLTQLKREPAGEEFNVILVVLPEHIDAASGGVTIGTGLMVIGKVEVGPWKVVQLKLVPYTSILPAVALAAKLTVIKASLGLIWVMVAPVPV